MPPAKRPSNKATTADMSRHIAICCRLVQSGQMAATVRFISGLVCPPTKMLLRVSHVPGIFSTFHANTRLPSAANLAAADTPCHDDNKIS